MNLTRLRRGVRQFALTASLVAASSATAAPLGVYDGSGALLGTYVGSASQSVEFVTPKGYVARVRVDGEASSEPIGTIQGVLDSAYTYNSPNCSGPALTSDPVAGRLVSISGAQQQLGYVPSDATPVTLPAGTAVSHRSYDSDECSTGTLSRDTTFLPASPNNPAVTGVTGGVVALPIRFAFVDDVFGDGFDTLT